MRGLWARVEVAVRFVARSLLFVALIASCRRGRDEMPAHARLAAAGHVPPLVAITEARVDSARCKALRPRDSLATSRAGFLEEVLDARPTSRTPSFDDYHEGSYHVDKQDLARALVDFSRACGFPLKGVVILGPVGPLWAYYVLAFFEESSTTIRANSVVMPHARITDKGTVMLASSTVDSLFRALAEAPVVEPRSHPPAPGADSSRLGREYSHDFLMLRVVGDSTATWTGIIAQSPDTAGARRTLEPINSLLKRLTSTYPDSVTRARRDREP